MPMTTKQFNACKRARISWGCLYVLGPNDRLPNGYLMDCYRATHNRLVKIQDEELNRIKAGYKDEP